MLIEFLVIVFVANAWKYILKTVYIA